jgi:SAM-dependent methyltransferase
MPRVNNKEFFSEQFKKFGDDAQGVNWGSKESQYARFKILAEYLDDIENSTIIDAGCGFGDFYQFLIENNKKPKSYMGLDITEDMVKSAKLKFDGVNFEVKDILNDELPKADYYIASGSLNMLTYKSTNKFIKNCFDSANKRFVFNILSSHSDFFEYGYNYVSPSELLANCMAVTPKVSLRHDYLPHDFTIIMNH